MHYWSKINDDDDDDDLLPLDSLENKPLQRNHEMGVEEADGRRCEPGPVWLPPRWLSLADVFKICRPMNNAPHWNTVSMKSAAAVTPCEPKSCEVQFWLIRFDFGFRRLIRLWEKCNKNWQTLEKLQAVSKCWDGQWWLKQAWI